MPRDRLARAKPPVKEADMPKYTLRVNGVSPSVQSADPNQPLLYALRSMELTATKFGCGLGQCGACTVHIDKKPVRSCLVPIASVKNKPITTLEGLGTTAKPHPLQAAFI